MGSGKGPAAFFHFSRRMQTFNEKQDEQKR
jgi:hypothetical protein